MYVCMYVSNLQPSMDVIRHTKLHSDVLINRFCLSTFARSVDCKLERFLLRPYKVHGPWRIQSSVGHPDLITKPAALSAYTRY